MIIDEEEDVPSSESDWDWGFLHDGWIYTARGTRFAIWDEAFPLPPTIIENRFVRFRYHGAFTFDEMREGTMGKGVSPYGTGEPIAAIRAEFEEGIDEQPAAVREALRAELDRLASHR